MAAWARSHAPVGRGSVLGHGEVPNVGPVRFEADQGPKHPWNAFELFAEYGFNPGDVTFFAGGLTFRF